MPDGESATEEELSKLKPMPFIAMVASVGSNDKPEMYNYLGGVKNDKRSDMLDAHRKNAPLSVNTNTLLAGAMKPLSVLSIFEKRTPVLGFSGGQASFDFCGQRNFY